MSETSQVEAKIKAEAFTAYLQPLIKKHEMNQELTYEDLTSSWQATNAVLGKMVEGDFTGTNKESLAEAVKTVREQAGALHKSQLTLYQEAAKSSLLDWSEKWILSPVPIPANMSLEVYCKSVESNAKKAQPLWRITKAYSAVLDQTYKRINQRAAELYNAVTTKATNTSTITAKDDNQITKEQQEKEQQLKEQNDLKEKLLAAKEKAMALKKQKEQRLQQIKESTSKEENESREIAEDIDESKAATTSVMKNDTEHHENSSAEREESLMDKKDVPTVDVEEEAKEQMTNSDDAEEGEIEEGTEDGEVMEADETVGNANEANHENDEEKSNQATTSSPSKAAATGGKIVRLGGNKMTKSTPQTNTNKTTGGKGPVRKKATTGKPLQAQARAGRGGRGRGRGGAASRA